MAKGTRRKRPFGTQRDKQDWLALSANRSRQKLRDDDWQKLHKSWEKEQLEYKRDPAAVLARYTEECEYCGNVLEPRVIPLAHTAGVKILRRERCGCEAEELALALQADQERELERQRTMGLYDKRLSNAGLVGTLSVATFETVRDAGDDGLYKKAAMEYTTALLGGALEHPWLLFHGPVGTGKSFLAACIVRACVDAGWSDAYFRPWTQWINRLRDSFGDDSISSHELTAEFSRGRLVVLDDLDKQRETRSGYAEDQLFNALATRYDKNLPTVITVNHRLSDLAVVNVIGYAGIDRIIGKTGGRNDKSQRIEFAGESKRSGVDYGLLAQGKDK